MRLTGSRSWDMHLSFGVLSLIFMLNCSVEAIHENLCFGIPLGSDKRLRYVGDSRPRRLNIQKLDDQHNIIPFLRTEQLLTVGSNAFFREEDPVIPEFLMRRWINVGQKPVLPGDPNFGAHFEFHEYNSKGLRENYMIGSKDSELQWYVDVYTIRDGKGVPLNGWLRINIALTDLAGVPVTDRDTTIYTLAISARGLYAADNDDKWHSGVGEFDHDGPTCDSTKWDEKLSKYQTVYCGGMSLYDNHLASGMAYVNFYHKGQKYQHGDRRKLGPILDPDNSRHHTVVTNFKFTTTPCSTLQSINFRVIGSIQFNKDRKTWYHSLHKTVSKQLDFTPGKFSFATDPLPQTGRLTCDKELIANDWNGLVKAVSNVSVDSRKCEDDFTCVPPLGAPARLTNIDKSKFLYENRYGLYKGRCDRSKKGEINSLQRCVSLNKEWKDAVEALGLETYEHYVKNIEASIDLACNDANAKLPCPTINPRPVTAAWVNTETGDKATQEDLRNAYMVSARAFRGLPIDRPKEMMLDLWDSRVYHGFFMCIITFIIIPINSLMARYYKETFMDTRIYFLRVWYFVHHQAAILLLMIFYMGMDRLLSRRKFLGVSLVEPAVSHRHMGWAAIALTIFLVVFGGIRPMHRLLRDFTIAIHFLLGFLLYALCLACFFLSVLIPGSPSSGYDIYKENNFVPENFRNLSILNLKRIGVFWIIFDIVIHVTLTVLQCLGDAKLKLKRKRFYLPSPMPILHEHFRMDLPGGLIRKIILAVYCSVSVIVTVIMCILMRIEPIYHRFFGPMSCTHMNSSEYFNTVQGFGHETSDCTLSI